MPLLSLSWAFLVVTTVAFCASTVAVKRRPKKARSTRWVVNVAPTTENVSFYGDGFRYGGDRYVNVSSTVQVTVEREAGGSSLIATLEIDDDDFDEKLSSAQARAEQKAASLNAYLGSGVRA